MTGLRPTLGAAMLVSGLSAGPALAVPAELHGLIESKRPAGCTEVRLLFWDLYRAELWSDAKALPGQSFGLSLTYRVDLDRDALVKSSIEEMARISGRAASSFATVRDQLAQAFHDVGKGDRITAWRAGPDDLRFFYNGKPTGALTRDVDLFLDIWIGKKARDADSRADLLSGTCHG